MTVARPRGVRRYGGVVSRRITLVAVALVALAAGCSSARSRAGTTPSTAPPTSATVPPVADTTAPTSTGIPAGSTPVPASSGCANQPDSAELDAELVQANGSPGGMTVPGSVYYGTCGTTSYAVARFQPAQDSTAAEQNSFQDEGVAPHYFIRAKGGTWTLVADGANFPSHMRDCSTFTQLPKELSTIWKDCVPNG